MDKDHSRHMRNHRRPPAKVACAPWPAIAAHRQAKRSERKPSWATGKPNTGDHPPVRRIRRRPPGRAVERARPQGPRLRGNPGVLEGPDRKEQTYPAAYTEALRKDTKAKWDELYAHQDRPCRSRAAKPAFTEEFLDDVDGGSDSPAPASRPGTEGEPAFPAQPHHQLSGRRGVRGVRQRLQHGPVGAPARTAVPWTGRTPQWPAPPSSTGSRP